MDNIEIKIPIQNKTNKRTSKRASSSSNGKNSMSPERLIQLKEILSIPSQYHKEDLVTAYIVNFCEEHHLEYIVDDLGSILITKGKLGDDGYYGMIGGHIDTVHPPEPKTIVENKGILTAWSKQNQQCGLGGDDLCSVHICLSLLQLLPVIKVGFFVGEEVFCEGSKSISKSHREWFKDVGYILEYDAPELMITQICNGVELFEENGIFINKIMSHLKRTLGKKLKFYSHPYTDVYVIRSEFNISCINLFAGYYNWHSRQEYVKIEEVEMAIELGVRIINELGFNRY